MDNFDLRKYLAENKLLKENEPKVSQERGEHSAVRDPKSPLLSDRVLDAIGDELKNAIYDGTLKLQANNGGYEAKGEEIYKSIHNIISQVTDLKHNWIPIYDVVTGILDKLKKKGIISIELSAKPEDSVENNPLEEMHNFKPRRYDYDDPNSPISILNDDPAAREAINSILKVHDEDVVEQWAKSYFGTNKPLKEGDNTAEELFKQFEDEGLLNDRRGYDTEDLMSAYPDLSETEAKKLKEWIKAHFYKSAPGSVPNRNPLGRSRGGYTGGWD